LSVFIGAPWILFFSGLVALHPRIKIFHGGWPRIFAKFLEKVRFGHKKKPPGGWPEGVGDGFAVLLPSVTLIHYQQ
ncbi:MAG: hypothetical protein IJS08_17560, partial [Victivallales bacterium]|nr:hypothetical protein [Victivallales bacterium]